MWLPGRFPSRRATRPATHFVTPVTRDLTHLVLKDKWRIDSFLGEGGVAAVYAATHRNGKRVAVKVLHPHLASIPEVRDRFLREGYLANRVDHPGAVGVLDDDVTDDGLVFFVMDLLDGESLEKRLAREGSLPLADVLGITAKLLDVLAAAHAKGIVHRDIKPENIFLLRDGSQRLLDFGIARLHEQAVTKNATQTGAAMGTPSYMPPEQARGHWDRVDGRSDLWAVGATMFTLLTGRCVHEGATINETLLLAMVAPAPVLASVWPAAPAPIAALVDRALASAMDERWPDAVTMLQAVYAASAALASMPSTSARPVSPMAAAPAMLQHTPAPVGGTVFAAAVGERPPAPRDLRKHVGIGVGAAIALVAFSLVLRLASGHGTTRPPATASSGPPPSAIDVPTADPLPSATLAPETPPVAPTASASVAPPPAVPSTTAAMKATPPAPSPARPVSTATTSPPSPLRPPAPPTSSPLDRRH
jgi:serine/threonine protein kinase